MKKNPAGFTIVLEVTEVNETIAKFNVIKGAPKINGTEYAITGGNGAVYSHICGATLSTKLSSQLRRKNFRHTVKHGKSKE
jgi:hypothetical protein